MVQRDMAPLLLKMAQSFRALLLTGPRQSGKSTLVRKLFPHKTYLSLENLDTRTFATEDPRLFLQRLPEGAILDEVQRCPALLNYMQEVLDQTNEDGLFILTSSNNLLLMESVTQSLAGRVGIAELLPLTQVEIARFDMPPLSLEERVRFGCFPEIFDRKREPYDWAAAYTKTYIERDVRLIRNIEDAAAFTRFVQVCAGRIGQQVNYQSMALDSGVDQRTVKSWLSILEQGYVVHLLRPYYRNFNKRLVKSPKLYFQDTALACYLLGIRTEEEMQLSHFRGALVENYLLNEVKRHVINSHLPYELYYWRDHKGIEADLIIDMGLSNGILPVELKAGMTFQMSMTQALRSFMDIAGLSKGVLVYGGEQATSVDGIEILPAGRMYEIVRM